MYLIGVVIKVLLHVRFNPINVKVSYLLDFIIISNFKFILILFYILANSQKKENTAASSSKKKSKKFIVINSDNENNCNNNKENISADNLEYQEKVLSLKERELSLREREAKVHALELANLEMEKKLKFSN